MKGSSSTRQKQRKKTYFALHDELQKPWWEEDREVGEGEELVLIIRECWRMLANRIHISAGLGCCPSAHQNKTRRDVSRQLEWGKAGSSLHMQSEHEEFILEWGMKSDHQTQKNSSSIRLRHMHRTTKEMFKRFYTGQRWNKISLQPRKTGLTSRVFIHGPSR